MRVVENLLGMTSLLAQAAAVGLALHLGAMLVLVWRREGVVRPWGAAEALRPQLLGLLLGVLMATAAAPFAAWLVLAPFVSWALGWHHARRDDATPLEVPAEGDPWLAVYRVAGMMAAGAAPAALTRFGLGPGLDGAVLVLPAVGLAIGVARASSGAAPELPQLLALVLAAHPRDEEEVVVAKPAARPRPAPRVAAPTLDEASVVAAAAAAAAPVDEGEENEGRAFARRLAQQALEAQLRVIRREEAQAAAAAAAEAAAVEAEAQAAREATARERAAAAAKAAEAARAAAVAAAAAAAAAEAAAVAAAAEVEAAPEIAAVVEAPVEEPVVLAVREDEGG